MNRSGFSPGAIKVLKEHNIYYSAAAEINELLHLFGIQRLLAEEKKSKAGKPAHKKGARRQKSEEGQQVQAKPAGLMGPKDPPQIVRSPNILGR